MPKALYPGYATGDGTADYTARMQDTYQDYLPASWLAGCQSFNDLKLSRLVLDLSDLSHKRRKHQDTVRESLISGTNQLAVHCNTDQNSAAYLARTTISELMQAGRLKRSELFIIASAGVSTYPLPAYPMQQNKDGSYICLHQAYLEDCLQSMLHWLCVDCIDLFLIQHPEALLNTEGDSHDLRDLEPLLELLRGFQKSGRIRHFGFVSDATYFNKYSPRAINLETLAHIAPDLSSLQFSGNVLESDFRFSRLNQGGRFADQIDSQGLWSICQRPLLAYQPGQHIVFKGMLQPPPDDGLSIIAELNRMQARLQELENNLLQMLADKHFHFDERLPAPSSYINQHRDSFHDSLDFKIKLPAIRHHLQATFNHLQLLAVDQSKRLTLQSLQTTTNNVYALWQNYIELQYQRRVQQFEIAMADSHESYIGLSLAQQCLLFLLSHPVPHTIQVQADSVARMRELQSVYRLKLPPPSSNLSSLSNLEDAVRKAIPEAFEDLKTE